MFLFINLIKLYYLLLALSLLLLLIFLLVLWSKLVNFFEQLTTRLLPLRQITNTTSIKGIDSFQIEY